MLRHPSTQRNNTIQTRGVRHDNNDQTRELAVASPVPYSDHADFSVRLRYNAFAQASGLRCTGLTRRPRIIRGTATGKVLAPFNNMIGSGRAIKSIQCDIGAFVYAA